MASITGNSNGNKKRFMNRQIKLFDDSWLVSPDRVDPTTSVKCERCSSKFSLIVSSRLYYQQ